MGRMRGRGPRLASSLLKEIGASGEPRKASADEEDEDKIGVDVYEYEEGVPEEERGKNRRFDDVERFEYELPSDFEDEEIDEEAAFGGDEDAADTDFKRVTKKGRKEVDLNSDEDNQGEEEEALEDDEEMDDDKQEPEVSDGEEEEEDVDEDDDEQHSRMIEAVTGKVGKVANVAPDRQRKRRSERVLSEAYPESEFNLNPSARNNLGNSAITVEDLMTPLHDKAGFSTIRKRMQQLQKRGAPVEAPLPKVIQERFDRKAGYEKTREDITKWQPIVKRNREAPSLVFNKQQRAPSLTIASLAANFKPTTPFEQEIHGILRENNLAEDKDVETAEALELNKLTVDEAKERRNRLAKMHTLLFRHEVKAKRLKKIKSQTFRKLRQKDQKSKAEVDAAIAGVDPEAAKAAAMKREFNRAQERMTLKHKNSSRWAKRILKRGLKASENDGTRDAIAEQLRSHAALTRKIESATLSDSDDVSSDSNEESEDVVPGLVLGGSSRSKVLAKAKLATLQALEDGEEVDLQGLGLFSLPFMARAIEKKKRTAQSEAMAVLEQLEQAEEDMTIPDWDDDYSRHQSGHLNEVSTSGRAVFGGAKSASLGPGNRDVNVDSSNLVDEDIDEEFVERVLDRAGNKGMVIDNTFSPSIQGLSRTNLRNEDDEGEARHYPRVESRSKDMFLQKERMAYSVAEIPKLDQRGIVLQNARMSSMGIDTVPAKPMQVVVAGTRKKTPGSSAPVVEAPSPTNENGKMSNGATLTQVENNAAQSTFSDDDSDADVQGVKLLDAGSSQQELIRQAFAGDDVETEFENLKSQILDEEVPQGEGPVSLPGWGQWTHVQKTKGEPTWLLKEREKLKRKRDGTLRKRKDASLKHVIISTKQDKKAAKFMAASVPFPFSSREIFERSTRLPIGRDFNTEKAYRDMIRPAVIKSAGVIIDPIKFEEPSVQKETQTTVHVAQRKRHRKT